MTVSIRGRYEALSLSRVAKSRWAEGGGGAREYDRKKVMRLVS